MGLREEIQSEVAAAFDEDLADAVSDISVLTLRTGTGIL